MGGYMTELLKKQLPPRGCVLKQQNLKPNVFSNCAAAFGRLCVETALSTEQYNCAKAEKQREDEIKKINSNFKYEIK